MAFKNLFGSKPKDDSVPNEGPREPRKMFQGSWTCVDCGKEITELPFEPRPGSENSIHCKECWAKNRPPKRF